MDDLAVNIATQVATDTANQICIHSALHDSGSANGGSNNTSGDGWGCCILVIIFAVCVLVYVVGGSVFNWW